MCGGGVGSPLGCNEKMKNHQHRTDRGRAEQVYLVKIEMCKARKWGAGWGWGWGRAGSEEEDWTLCGPLHSSCPPYQCSTDPPLPWLIRMGLLWPYCSFPAWIVPVCPSLSQDWPAAVDSQEVTDRLLTSASSLPQPPFVRLWDCCSKLWTDSDSIFMKYR